MFFDGGVCVDAGYVDVDDIECVGVVVDDIGVACASVVVGCGGGGGSAVGGGAGVE